MSQETLTLEMVRDSPEKISEALLNCARSSAACLRQSLHRQEALEPSELTQEVFNNLYDSSLPTLGMDTAALFEAAETVAMANAQKPDRKCNIVFLTPLATQYSAATSTSSGRLYVADGLLIDKKGQVYYGRFPQKIQVDVLESADLHTLNHCREKGIPILNEYDELCISRDKRRISDLSLPPDMRTPKRYHADELSPNLDIVIKPSNELQGRGVFFGSKYPGDITRWRRYYDFLTEHGYDPIIEERIRTYPLFSPKTGDRLDWNVRSIVSHGAHIGSYMRIGSHDYAVNQGAGANAVSLDALAFFLHKDVSQPKRKTSELLGKLVNAASAFAKERPFFLAGLDLTVEEKTEDVVLFESNHGNVGGLEDIANMDAQLGFDALKAARRILTGIERFLSVNSGTRLLDDNSEILPLPLGMAATTFSLLRTTGAEALIGAGIDIIDPYADKDTYMIALALRCGVTGSPTRSSNPGLFASRMSDFALDLYSREYLLDRSILGSDIIVAQLDEWLDIDPKSTDWALLRLYSALDTHKFAEAKGLVTQYDLFSADDDLTPFSKSVAQDVIGVDTSDEVSKAMTDEMAEVIRIFFSTQITDDELRTSLKNALCAIGLGSTQDTKQSSQLSDDATFKEDCLTINVAYMKLFCAMERYDVAREVLDSLRPEGKMHQYLDEIILKPHAEHMRKSPEGAAFHDSVLAKIAECS